MGGWDAIHWDDAGPCACGRGRVYDTIEMDDWNRRRPGRERRCPYCDGKELFEQNFPCYRYEIGMDGLDDELFYPWLGRQSVNWLCNHVHRVEYPYVVRKNQVLHELERARNITQQNLNSCSIEFERRSLLNYSGIHVVRKRMTELIVAHGYSKADAGFYADMRLLEFKRNDKQILQKCYDSHVDITHVKGVSDYTMRGVVASYKERFGKGRLSLAKKALYAYLQLEPFDDVEVYLIEVKEHERQLKLDEQTEMDNLRAKLEAASKKLREFQSSLQTDEGYVYCKMLSDNQYSYERFQVVKRAFLQSSQSCE